MVVARPRACVGCSTMRSPCLPLVRKFSTMQSLCVVLASARVPVRCARALSMESFLVALSTASGEGLSGREPQSGVVMVRHRGALE
jgi:hypothetical protein